MLKSISINYRKRAFRVTLDAFGFQFEREGNWIFYWTHDLRWGLEVKSNGEWHGRWHWDRREHLLPTFRPHPSYY